MTYVLMVGNPSGARRKARWSVFSDHMAVPSRSRSGDRRTSRRIRSSSARPYTFRWPPPCLESNAPRPLSVEACHKIRHSLRASPPRSPGGLSKAGPVVDRNQYPGARDSIGRVRTRPADSL
jgi:hypothetical protein